MNHTFHIQVLFYGGIGYQEMEYYTMVKVLVLRIEEEMLQHGTAKGRELIG